MEPDQLEQLVDVAKEIANKLEALNRTLEKTLTMVAVATPWAGR